MIGKGKDVNPSTPRPEDLGLPSSRDFEELSRVAQAEGLSLPAPPSVGTGAGRQGLTLSGASFPRLKKGGAWGRRMGQ